LRFLLSPALFTALAVSLAGCTPSPPAQTAGATAAQPADPAPEAGPARGTGRGTVTIAGDDAAEDI